MTIVDDTRLATLARTLADLQRAHADLEMDFTKARVALGRHRHSTATLAEDIERVVALADAQPHGGKAPIRESSSPASMSRVDADWRVVVSPESVEAIAARTIGMMRDAYRVEVQPPAPTPIDPAALLRATIAKAATRAQPYDFAGLLTLAQALESVNRAPPVAPSPMQYPDLNHIELVRLRRVVAKVEALRDKWRSTGGISTTDIERALRGEDPSDG